jgi:release factor glutamine methyltransferase
MSQLFQRLKEATELLRSKNFERAEVEARALMSIVLGCDAAAIIALDDRPLLPKEGLQFDELLKRRLRYEPLAYLRGEKEFFGRKFKVSPGCLIPRPETESLVEEVIRWIRSRGISSGKIIDIGTGSGCIALSLQRELGSEFSFTAVDRSSEALSVAKSNAQSLGASNIEFLQWDLLRSEDLPSANEWTVVVSNPPYIPSAEIPDLQADVRDFEPRMALDGGEDGLLFVREIIDRFWPSLTIPGLLALELHSSAQREHVQAEFSSLRMKDWVVGPHLLMERL